MHWWVPLTATLQRLTVLYTLRQEGLLNITGIKERMPWWLRWIWERWFKKQLDLRMPRSGSK